MTVHRWWAAGSSVADVSHAGCGPCVFDEDLAVQVGHGDHVAVDDDQDLFETAPRGSMGPLTATTRASGLKCHHHDHPNCHRCLER